MNLVKIWKCLDRQYNRESFHLSHSEVECTSTVCRKCLAVFQRAFDNFNCEKPCSRCIFCTGNFVNLPLCKQYCMDGGVKGCSSRCEKGKSVCMKCCSNVWIFVIKVKKKMFIICYGYRQYVTIFPVLLESHGILRPGLLCRVLCINILGSFRWHLSSKQWNAVWNWSKKENIYYLHTMQTNFENFLPQLFQIVLN